MRDLPMFNTGMRTSATAEWSTPHDFWATLNDEFGFNLDVCSTHENAKCENHFTEAENGLVQTWRGICWMNPPYGSGMSNWCRKAYESVRSGVAPIVVGLVPARTDTRWFHDWVLGKAEIRFIRGRLKFGGSDSHAPFPSLVVIWRSTQAPESSS